MSGEEQLKEVYRRIIDAISRGDADGLDELVAPDIVDHNPAPNQALGQAVDGRCADCIRGPRRRVVGHRICSGRCSN